MSDEKIDIEHFEGKGSENTSVHHDSKTVIDTRMRSELAAVLAKEKPRKSRILLLARF